MVSIIVGSLLGVQGFVASTHPVGTDNGLTGGGAAPPKPLMLNSVDYALKVVGDKVLIPDASRVGPGHAIIGVQLDKPQLITTNTGVIWRDWGIAFFISDMPLVNGTSMKTDFSGHLIVVRESVSPGILNSHDNAVSYMAPQKICQTFNNGTQACADIASNRGQLIQIRSTWLVVNQDGNTNADFTIDGINRAVDISGDMSYQQMLALADSMIP
jgi:hypothetical protein